MTIRNEIRLPRLGWSMEEGTFVQWLKQPGEAVRAGDPLFVLENDKATQDVEAIDSGRLVLTDQSPKAGDILAVGAVLGYLVDENESEITTDVAAQVANGSDAEVAAEVPNVPAELVEDIAAHTHTEGIEASVWQEAKASPRARRTAASLGVNLNLVLPGGTSGRIRECDVVAHASTQHSATSTTAMHAEACVAASDPMAVQKLTETRQAIAARMLASHVNTAPVTLTARANVNNLVSMREQFKARAASCVASTEPKVNSPQPDAILIPSYSDIIIKLVAGVLQHHLHLASRFSSDGLIAPKGLHIGLAVDTDYGLVVPVVRDVQSLSLLQVTQQSNALIQAARSRQLKSQQMCDGVFTITNLGSFGIDAFTPIINQPEVAILGLGTIAREPYVQADGSLSSCWQMTLSLTIDHRVIDGAPAARFLKQLIQTLENPVPALL